MAMNNLMRMMVPGRRSVKSMAMMGAASWAVNRLARRSKVARRGVLAMEAATWAVPLGLAAYHRVRARRDADRLAGA
jgi:hypothetical protein